MRLCLKVWFERANCRGRRDKFKADDTVDLAIAEFILATSAGRLELSDLLRDIGKKVFRAITAFLPTRNCGDDAAVLATQMGQS